jgi:hypothetical protein
VLTSQAAAAWFDARAIPQDLIEGVVTTFIGIAILFLIKPRLEIRLAAPRRTASRQDDERSDKFSFRVTNVGRLKAVEIKVRLLKVRRYGPRKKIDLVTDELFELRGQWSPLTPSAPTLLRARLERLRADEASRESAQEKLSRLIASRQRNRRERGRYTFYPFHGELEQAIAGLGEDDYILFQVAARNAFTGFSRLRIRRFERAELEALTGKSDAPESAGEPA